MRNIDQLSRGHWMGLMLGGAVAAASVFSGCSGDFTSCQADKNCGPYDGPSGGTAGSAGQSGASGQSGAGGHSGQSGASGQGGSGSGAGGAGGGGAEAGAAGADTGVPCDTTKTPTTESCLVDDAYGIFVAPSGNDSNLGSMGAPVKTIAKAIELAQADGKFVVACDGTYDERVTISAGVQLYGGFACPGGAGVAWAAETSGKAKVAPTARGIALSIASPTAPVAIENFEFDAQDGVDAGESSIAAFVNGSTKVTLTSVKLVAGKGVDGANGSLTALTFPMQSMLNGNAASGDMGGAFKMCTCDAGGTSKGGQGGNGGGAATGGGAGAPDLGGGLAGLFNGMCAGPGTGGTGADAPAQSAAAGANKSGSITSTGWSGEPGKDGGIGTPGQGGGGGTGAATGGGGGGGGCGGCGGAGGTAGKAGGSSIALLVMSSVVSLVSSEFTASDAGKGGGGVAGQAGQTVSGSGGVQTPDGCAGGKGGKGGAGGASGGGAGGISVGIAWTGSSTMDQMPTAMMAATTITTGALGAKGVGGVPGANDGIDGVKQDVLKVP